MKIIPIILLLACISTLANAQRYTHDPKIEKEVNEQVWKPFKQSYETRDWKTLNALHTDDVLRISKWSGILEGKEYKDRVKQSNQQTTQSSKTIDFWFEHRIYAARVGYEVGYYRIVYEEPGKESRTSYARFHVVLRKESGSWKIAQDWDIDTINGNPVDAVEFSKGKVIEF